MRLLFKLNIIIIVIQSTIFAVGTQFLSIPQNSSELIFGYNPAIAITSTKPIISASYGNWLADIKVSSMQYDRSLAGGWLGMNFRYISLNDLELRTDRPTDEPLSYYNSTALAIDGKYSRQYKFGLLSTSVRYVSIQLLDATSNGIAADINLKRKIYDDLDIGFAILNVGYMSELFKEKPELPLRTMVGGTYNFELKQIDNTLSAVLEKSSLVDGLIFRLTESINFDKIQILIGTQIAENATSLSGGINIKLGSYFFGYSVQIGKQSLGIPQMLSFTIKLP